MNYLVYIEHSAENLQFFLWHRSYVSRFHSANTIDLVLAPEWTQEMQNETFAKLQKEQLEGLRRDPAHMAPVFRGTTFEKKGNRGTPGGLLERPSPIFSETGSNPFLTPPRTPLDRDDLTSLSPSSSSGFGVGVGSHTTSYRSQANEAFAAAGIKAPCKFEHPHPHEDPVDQTRLIIMWFFLTTEPKDVNEEEEEEEEEKKRKVKTKSFTDRWPFPYNTVTIQPFREEIDRVIATYLMDDSPRQLNLSARERKHLLTALSHTTHPTAFRQTARSVETTLRMQAHPNFLRWSICNGNPPRVVFANLLGGVLILGSLVAYLLLCLSAVPRGVRAVPAVGMVLGVATQCAAAKGMCVVLHGMHHRHVRPWELFCDEEVELRDEKDAGSGSGLSLSLSSLGRGGGGGGGKSFESFGSANSYEDEPWVVKYQRRNLVRKVFDREVWIQEPALRSIQDTIFVQALLVAAVTAGALTAIFVCVPGGNFY